MLVGHDQHLFWTQIYLFPIPFVLQDMLLGRESEIGAPEATRQGTGGSASGEDSANADRGGPLEPRCS